MRNLINIDTGLLVLRIWLAIGLFTNHGWEKLSGFNAMLVDFPDPLNLGKTISLVFALLSDGICSILVALGIFTRFSSFVIVLNMTVAFFIFWKTQITQIHGELPFIYLGAYMSLLIMGAGEYSLDKHFHKVYAYSFKSKTKEHQ